MTNKIQQMFEPFVGQVIWQVRRGHGSFLTMEFGNPHLSVREPITTSYSSSDKVKRTLQRRHIDVVGDWRLWIQNAEWKLATKNGILTNDDLAGSPSEECLRDLDGQRLVRVDLGMKERSCVFTFDLGGSLEIRPSASIPEEQWGLYGWEGDIVTCNHDGQLVFERANLERRVYRPLKVAWSRPVKAD
jgi:hypothetical protein